MTEPQPVMAQAEQDQLTRQVGRALLTVAGPDWQQIRAEYRSVGRHIEADVVVKGPDGAEHPVRPPQEVVDGLGKLRQGMYRPGRGTWLSALYVLDPPSAFSAEFEPDVEPRWRRVPPPIGFADELRFFPREDDNIPDWFRRRAGLPPLNDDQDTPATPPGGTPAPGHTGAPQPPAGDRPAPGGRGGNPAPGPSGPGTPAGPGNQGGPSNQGGPGNATRPGNQGGPGNPATGPHSPGGPGRPGPGGAPMAGAPRRGEATPARPSGPPTPPPGIPRTPTPPPGIPATPYGDHPPSPPHGFAGPHHEGTPFVNGDQTAR